MFLFARDSDLRVYYIIILDQVISRGVMYLAAENRVFFSSSYEGLSMCCVYSMVYELKLVKAEC